MQIKIENGIWKRLAKQTGDEEMERSCGWRSDKEGGERELDDLSTEQIDALENLLEANKESQGAAHALKRISTWRNIQKDPSGRPVGRLEDLVQALKVHITKEHKGHWLMQDIGDLLLCWYVSDIKYIEGERDSPAHTNLRCKAIFRGEEISRHLTWHQEDLRGSKTVVELLQGKDMHTPTKATLAFYESTVKQYKLYQPQTGEQFIAEGEGSELSDRYSSRRTALVRDGVPVKLVMDDLSEEGREFGKDDGMESAVFWFNPDKGEDEEAGRVALPLHPYVKLFDLDNHCFVIAHTDQLTPYQWTPEIGDKLILPEEHKQVIQILMETAADDIDDIIKGKSGGTIVISTGEPGTGKTLTAEVTSEVIKRPLYKVNCSQLGTDEEEIEKELNLVLNRSARWKALLLIDEADVYVRERGTDIQQNAIVGVFLRVLEYYRGVLFLTSNMATVIDDAIMSRATVHIKYKKPTPQALVTIWSTLAEQFEIKLSDVFIKELCKTFPEVVGRDVKNLLKLVIRWGKKNKGDHSLDVFKMLAKHKDIKVAGA